MKVKENGELLFKPVNVPIYETTRGDYTNYKGSLQIPDKGISIAMQVSKPDKDYKGKYGAEVAYFVRCAIFKYNGKK